MWALGRQDALANFGNWTELMAYFNGAQSDYTLKWCVRASVTRTPCARTRPTEPHVHPYM